MKHLIYLVSVLWLVSCAGSDEYSDIYTSKINWINIERNLQSRFITAKPGDTIHLEAGYYWFTKSLIIDHKIDFICLPNF